MRSLDAVLAGFTMSPALPPPIDGAAAFVVVNAPTVRLWRLLRDSHPTRSDFEARLTRPQAARLGIAELFRNTVSHFLTRERAIAQSRFHTGYVACIDLVGNPLVHAAFTPFEHPDHVDVWAAPELLLSCVVDIQRFVEAR